MLLLSQFMLYCVGVSENAMVLKNNHPKPLSALRLESFLGANDSESFPVYKLPSVQSTYFLSLFSDGVRMA